MDSLEPLVQPLWEIAQALHRLATVAERVYPPPPDRSQVQPAGEEALTRPRLKELAQWEETDDPLRLPLETWRTRRTLR